MTYLGSSGRIRTYNPSVNSYGSHLFRTYSSVIMIDQDPSFTFVSRTSNHMAVAND
jgi:hypothetical protein